MKASSPLPSLGRRNWAGPPNCGCRCTGRGAEQVGPRSGSVTQHGVASLVCHAFGLGLLPTGLVSSLRVDTVGPGDTSSCWACQGWWLWEGAAGARVGGGERGAGGWDTGRGTPVS